MRWLSLGIPIPYQSPTKRFAVTAMELSQQNLRKTTYAMRGYIKLERGRTGIAA
jgi:hypothetical protein